jgi:hypothetical protein
VTLDRHEVLDIAALSRLTTALRSPADTFGLDQRVQFAIDASLPDRAAIAKCYYRPLQEPVLWSFWEDLKHRAFDEKKALEIVSLMVGKRVTLRSCAKSGGDTETGETFVFDQGNPRWLFEIVGQAANPRQPAIAGDIERLLTDLFYHTIWIHPFDDGNGRFSRGLIYGLLARVGLISAPCLGLNAVFDFRRNRIGTAFRHAASTGDRLPLRHELCSAINLAARLAHGVLLGNYQADLDT